MAKVNVKPTEKIIEEAAIAVTAVEEAVPPPLIVASDHPIEEPPVKKKPRARKAAKEDEEMVDTGFTEHAVPTEEEIREEEIDESLKEIYQDDNGGMVNVSKLEKIKSHGFLYYLFTTLLTVAIIGGALWAGYNFVYLKSQSDAEAVDLTIDAPRVLASGQEFVYTVNYKNLNAVELKNIEIRMSYPENYKPLSSDPVSSEKDNIWRIDSLGPHRSGKIEIKGKIIGPQDQVAAITADMSYTPANFSSTFEKAASYESVISSTGIDMSFEAQSSVLVNEANIITVKYQPSQDDNYISHFRLTVTGPENFSISSTTDAKTDDVENPQPGVWVVNKMEKDLSAINIKFKFKSKLADSADVVLAFETSDDGNQYYKFLEKKLTFNILQNDLNLNLIMNGSRNDQGIDFEQTLNYSIVYSDKGDQEMKDVIIMAVLNGDILDWSTLKDANKGQVRGNTISWTKDEIPALASLTKGNEGTIDFSIKVVPLSKVGAGSAGFDPNRKYEVQNYAQFSIGNKDASSSDDTKSNIIVCKVNSDLKLDEQVRYFNSDNIAVGSGPVPPKVGQTTSFKVFWTITNNLHELNNLRVETALPSYVQWDSKNRTSVGTLGFDEVSRKVIWDLDRLPIDVTNITAEFSISITPQESDADTIMVLLPGTTVHAVDNVTSAEINKTNKAKTTKLEDDEIANGDGRITR